MLPARESSKPARKSQSRSGGYDAQPSDPALTEKNLIDMPRHRAIYQELLFQIKSGFYKQGERLPSEAVLCERFQASRITVSKAFQSLQLDHLVVRRPGSGTYVQSRPQESSRQFGVLIPDFGTTDIFEPICQGILRSPAAQFHSLTWGSSTAGSSDPGQIAEQLCQQYIAQAVAGVFFAPSEHLETRCEQNRKLVAMLERAGIPVVLLDRDFVRYPDRSNYDLVGIDNHRAGYILTRHLLQAGSKRVVFAMRTNSAPTVDARAAGYREALYSLTQNHPPIIFSTDFSTPGDLTEMLDRHQPDGIVCANDITAARLMQALIPLGIRIPEDVRMAGVDDVSYAKFLPTPLTSLRQNCAEIGAVAMSTMLDRLSAPNHPVRDVLVRCDLIVRASCGSTPQTEP